jgi:hypothetical protein
MYQSYKHSKWVAMPEKASPRRPPLRARSSIHKCRNTQSLVTHASSRHWWCETVQIHEMRLCSNQSEIWPIQNAGKRRIYQVAGVARTPRNTSRSSLSRSKGDPLLVPVRSSPRKRQTIDGGRPVTPFWIYFFDQRHVWIILHGPWVCHGYGGRPYKTLFPSEPRTRWGVPVRFKPPDRTLYSVRTGQLCTVSDQDWWRVRYWLFFLALCVYLYSMGGTVSEWLQYLTWYTQRVLCVYSRIRYYLVTEDQVRTEGEGYKKKRTRRPISHQK